MESGELDIETDKELQGEGDRPPREFCDGTASMSGDIKRQGEMVWQDLSNKYGLFGCSFHRSTKKRKLSLATSSSSATGGGGLGFLLSQVCARHWVADMRRLEGKADKDPELRTN